MTKCSFDKELIYFFFVILWDKNIINPRQIFFLFIARFFKNLYMTWINHGCEMVVTVYGVEYKTL